MTTNLETAVDGPWHVREHPLERARPTWAEQPSRNQSIAHLKPFLVAHVLEGALELAQPPAFSWDFALLLLDLLQLQLFV